MMDMELLKEIASKCNGSVIDGCLKEIAHLRQQIATHTASQTDRDKAVAEACAAVSDSVDTFASSNPPVMISKLIRSGEWRKYRKGK